jgi:hypothetical protein
MTKLISWTCLLLTVHLTFAKVLVLICHTYTVSFSYSIVEQNYFATGCYSDVSDDTVTRGVHREKLAVCGYVKSDKR